MLDKLTNSWYVLAWMHTIPPYKREALRGGFAIRHFYLIITQSKLSSSEPALYFFLAWVIYDYFIKIFYPMLLALDYMAQLVKDNKSEW